MNFKLKIILFVIIILASVSGSAYSQGIFKSQQPTTNTPSSGGILRGAITDPTDQVPGLVSPNTTFNIDNPTDQPPGQTQTTTPFPITDPNDQPPGQTPVGGGLAILSLLSGVYFMLKKRNSRD